jgi:Ca-activated chloride channel family protein
MMRRLGVICSLPILLIAQAGRIDAQTSSVAAQSGEGYRLNVAVDEVGLTFHAADAHGLPVNDLKLDELSLLDNGRPPRRILAFQYLQDSPIRAGILVDTSDSMREFIASNRAISIEYAQRILRQQIDQAFVVNFGYVSKIVQPWTGDPMELSSGVRRVRAGEESPLGGTAMYDTIFHTCFYEFGKIDRGTTGNFILLFSDGEDNVSHMSLKETIDACQHTNTAIYAFRAEPASGFFSGGAATLAELAAKTGGRVFHASSSEAEIYDDLRIIEGDLRNQYRLVYKAALLKHDGSFHRIELKPPERVDSIVIRSGYYAPAQ